jgi:O-antigen ligase
MAGLAHLTRSSGFFDRERLLRLADLLAIALAVSLPWSTSATGILAGLWLIVVIPTFNVATLRQVISTPAGGLPVLLWSLAVVGMLWAVGVPLTERLDGLSGFHKLLFIPLFIAHFHHSERGGRVLGGYLASCGALLALSWLLFMMPDMPWFGHMQTRGVPAKDYIAQGAEFTVCIFLLAGVALEAWRKRRLWLATMLLLLAIIFLANVFYVLISRTALVVMPVLLLAFACRKVPWKGTLGLLVAGLVLAGLTWSFVPNVRTNLSKLAGEIREFRPDGTRTRAGERLEFWTKSIGFVAGAPLIGHGTGSIRDQFRRTVEGKTGMAAVASANPHNQTLAVAIQLGLAGTVVLFAMWLAHLLLFRGEGLVAWAGLVIVIQNIVSSLFNSHLFDFTQGWGYVIGVGVAGGMIFKTYAGVQPGHAAAIRGSG